MTRWQVMGPGGVPLKRPRRVRVRWWWYATVLFVFGVVLGLILTSCGDSGFSEEDYDWFPATSPSGVKLECIGYGESIWCRELGEP